MKTYKLAANFNTVEFTIDKEDLMSVLDWDEEVFEDAEGMPMWEVSDEELTKRVLQREYNILASIKVVHVAPASQGFIAPVKEEEAATEKQIKWAKSLGMKDPEKATKKEVWAYIQKHKDD
jgi:hypothetical protein